MRTRTSRNKNEWKLKKNQSHFTDIFVFYAGDPTKRLKPASASTAMIIRGGNVLRAKTNLPLITNHFLMTVRMLVLILT